MAVVMIELLLWDGPMAYQYDLGSPRSCSATKLRIISRLTGAVFRRRAPFQIWIKPYSSEKPLPPCTSMATSAALMARSAARNFAMLARLATSAGGGPPGFPPAPFFGFLPPPSRVV